MLKTSFMNDSFRLNLKPLKKTQFNFRCNHTILLCPSLASCATDGPPSRDSDQSVTPPNPPTTTQPPRITIRTKSMSNSTSSSSLEKRLVLENEVEHSQSQILDAVEDSYGGVTVNMEKPMDSKVFTSVLRTSLSCWRQQGKKGVWIKLPIQLANLVEPTVQEGFRYHHAEPDYLMLVYWIPETADTIPANTSHIISVCAFVMNDKGEVLVVNERSGKFGGTGVWKFPTGVAEEGEDIWTAAIREVKEETGVDTEFVEVLAFRQSHRSFFQKSDLMFICMLRPCSSDIQKQDSEIEAAQWMAAEDYAAQSFVRKHEQFNYVAKICLTKSEKAYAGFSPIPALTSSGKINYIYFNNRDCDLSAYRNQ